MLFSLLLTALTATSGEDTHTLYSEGEGHLLKGGCVCTVQFCYSDPLRLLRLNVRARNSAVEYQVERRDGVMSRLIAGYVVFRFGVPMIEEYDIERNRRTVTISPAVPGAQHRITAWSIGSRGRSERPEVAYATTGETSKPKYGEVNSNILLVDDN